MPIENPTVLVVEDHPIVQRMIVRHLERMGVRIAGTAGSGEEALRQLETLVPDVMLLDLSLPGMSGLELLRLTRTRAPRVACVVLTGHLEPAYRTRAFELGACGFVLKENPALLVEAVRAVLTGETWGIESPAPV